MMVMAVTTRLRLFICLIIHFLSNASTKVSSYISCHALSSDAFVTVRSSASTWACRGRLSTTCKYSPQPNYPRIEGEINRRDVLLSTTSKILTTVTAATFIRPSFASAAEAAAVASPRTYQPSPLVSNTLCDPSVSTWIKTYNQNGSKYMRTIHILGTAHISASSAQLAGAMVRELRPNVVFVELDAKRVGRAIPSGNLRASTDQYKLNIGGQTVDATLTPQTSTASSSGAESTSTISSNTFQQTVNAPKKSSVFDVKSKVVDVGSKYVGDAVKGMYGKLESEGFKAGDEFAMSVREGLAIGSTIVLGDRDVEVTLRRLTQALTKTDIRKLISADSEVEKSMEELLPENMKAQLRQSSTVGRDIVKNEGSLRGNGIGTQDLVIDKQEFETFVETMKARENVKKIMVALQKMAPEVYEAMVAERDLYMGRGLDELGVNLNGNVQNTVAVMGMAHVDGVERYLFSQGWTQMTYPCHARASK